MTAPLTRVGAVNPALSAGKDALKAGPVTPGWRTCGTAAPKPSGAARREGEALSAAPDDTYLAVWPVLDPTRTVPLLIAEAQPALDLLLEQSGVRPAGPTDWHVTGDAVWPGAIDGLVLVARLPVRTADPDAPGLVQPDERTPARAARDERVQRVRRLTAAGLSASEVALCLGLSERQVVRDRATTTTGAAA